MYHFLKINLFLFLFFVKKNTENCNFEGFSIYFFNKKNIAESLGFWRCIKGIKLLMLSCKIQLLEIFFKTLTIRGIFFSRGDGGGREASKCTAEEQNI